MKTIVILHGWQSCKEKWQKVKEQLEESDLKVIVPDIPGFKPETALNKPWNLDDYIDWFQDFLAGQNIAEPFFLLGHSFGGRMTIKYASKNPEKLKGIILVSSAGIKNKSLNVRILRKVAKIMKKFNIVEGASVLSGLWQFLRKVFYRFILRKTDYIKTSGALTGTIKNILDEDLISVLEKISTPTCLIWGSKDKMTPLKDGYLMQKMIKNSQLKILNGIGHTPHLESPRALTKIIIEWILKS